MNSVVIARYNESLDWIVGIPHEFEIFLYNKGEAITDPAILARANHIIARPNEGRESETYIHHMVTRVPNDRSYTVFAQGDPFTHSPDFLLLLQNWRQWDKLQPLSWQWREDGNVPPALVLADYEAHLQGRLRVRPERFSLSTWNPLDFFDEGALGTSLDYRAMHGDLPEGTNIASHFLGLCQLPELAAKAQAHALGIFCYGAIFAVQNDLIIKFSKESLERIYPATKAAPVYGYVLERMWLHFFGAEFELTKAPPKIVEQSGLQPAAPLSLVEQHAYA